MNRLIIFIVAVAGILGTAFAERISEKNPGSPSATITNNSETYVCKRCDGTGYEPSITKGCPYCNRGRVQHFRNCEVCYGEGFQIDKYGDKQKCRNCDGTGKLYVEEICAYCNGTGAVKMTCMTCHGTGSVQK